MENRNHNSQRNMAFPFLALESGFAFIPRSKPSIGDIMTAKQIKDLQRRNAQLEEENLILKKAIIFVVA